MGCIKKILINTFLIILMYSLSSAQTELKTRDLVTGLDTPWEIIWGPDNYIWMTERYGRVSRVNPQTGELTEILRLPEVLEDGERGLMGMVLHPQFYSQVPEIPNYPYVYLIYNYGTKADSKVKIVRYTYSDNKLDSPVELMKDIPGAWNHDGSRLWINPNDWTLYVTMGDAAVSDRAQNLSSLNGKILRMNLDGTIPSDNPYGNSYVWSWGHRNPQGLVVAKGIIYSSEHGPDTDDELNIIYKGRNYGWPNVRGFCDLPAEKTFCEQNDVVEPIACWTPTIAAAGIDYYNYDLISDWKNSILLVALKGSKLVQLKLSEPGTEIVSQTNYFAGKFGRLRDICISPDGKVYIATSNKDGRGSPRSGDDRIIEVTPSTLKKNDDESGLDKINIYPNPFSNKIYFDIGAINNDYTMEIYDILGNKIKEFKSGDLLNKIWDGKDEYEVEVKSGIYFVRFIFHEKIYLAKLIKTGL
ncbi:MAG: T9SS type A sorting domain-containing protein [Bacteroidetes bacterium]|nr:MAG: T9SS type A sorting domain-containing protein [Bacteroidota bacterium]